MSLSAPFGEFVIVVLMHVSGLGRPGGDLLSRVLRRSTIGAEGFHGRVRDGIGCLTPRHDHQVVASRNGRRREEAPFVQAFAGGKSWGARVRPRDLFLLPWIKPIERLVPVSFAHRCASTPGLSTWWSSTALIGRTGFEVGFPLRCFQRLSRPDLATLHCGWRHNRSTRDPSTPVLSY